MMGFLRARRRLGSSDDGGRPALVWRSVPPARLAPDGYLRLATVIGAVVLTGLLVLHTYTIWWSVSPIGFVIASTYTEDYLLWHSALIAWLLTTQLKRCGGLKLHRAFRPAFLGMILVDILGSAFFGPPNTVLDYHKMMGG